MENTVQNSIRELADELKRFNRNDVLVNFSDKDSISIPNQVCEISLPLEGELLKTYKKAQNIFRESGTSVFCLSKGILKWEWNGLPCQTPILLCPVTVKMNKVKNNLHLTWDSEEAFINPFLDFSFQRQYEFNWPKIDFSEANWQEIQSFLLDRGFEYTIEDKTHYGNFHHHRFSILRELEMLSSTVDLSPVLQSVFHSHEAQKSEVLDLVRANLFPADNDQMTVFQEFGKGNLVVHGPPGTGKSQVLANVLGKSLAMNMRTLVVSEKRVALEVLKQKLESTGLEHFVFLQDGTSNAQNLLNHLKDTWQFLEQYEPVRDGKIPVAALKKEGLQFKLNVLSNPKLIGGISYLTFQELVKQKDLAPIPYTSAAPTIAEFMDLKPKLDHLFTNKISIICRIIPQKLIVTDNVFQLDEKIKQVEKQWKSQSQHFDLSSPFDLQIAMKKASFAQLLSNEAQQDYFKILQPTSGERKKFQRLSTHYFTLKKELEIVRSKDDHWKKPLSESETFTLLEKAENGSYFQRLKVKKQLSPYLKTGILSPEIALKNHLGFLEKQNEFRKIEIKLAEIGVRTETEIHLLKNLCQQLSQENYKIWHETDAKTNQLLADQNGELYNLYQNIRTYFQLEETDSIEKAFQQINASFSDFLAHRQVLLNLSSDAYKLLGQCQSLTEFEDLTLKSNWIRFVEQFPAFKDFELSQFNGLLDDIIEEESAESEQLVRFIIKQQKDKFEILGELLQTPSRKLSTENKTKKASLRKGRALLIKEFGKTRNHPTIRELLESEAREWIYTLLPIWMLNPAQVGDFFPLERELFDLTLFDEATQIPLAHAMGSLQRARKALVLGDEHQMSPTSFFKAGDSEPIDLLHQCRFNWPKVMLKHHYRSEHPELIAFSNRFFYDNELIAYPNSKLDAEPIRLHFIDNGEYADQENLNEARAMAHAISEQLKQKGTLGIVAFSEKQLNRILQELTINQRQILDVKIEENEAFCRALENVQGEECDHLFVSLGYGPDAEGKLNLNFGPLNRKSGRRRLNVLLSRAKKKIAFFTSIKSTDLSLSDNDSLNLLRQFLQQAESQKTEKEIRFPLGLQIKSHSQNGTKTEVRFENLLNRITDVNELLTLYRVLRQRGWEINFS